MTTTLIKNAGWAIAWDAGEKRHVYRKGIDVAFGPRGITHVGPDFRGAAEVTIDGRGLMVMPGLVNVHSHLSHEPVYRGIREEHGVPNMYMTSLYERSQAFDVSDPALRRASLEVALCEVLKSGVTTVCDISPIYDGWADIVGKSGIRGFLAPGFADARWKLSDDHSLGFDWDEARGRKGLDAALAFIDGLPKHASGMLSGVVSPMQIENCTDALLRDSFDAAKERRVPFTLHAAQGVLEHIEMVKRHGTTSIRHASDIGILGPTTVIGHAILPDSHSWIRWHTKDDIRLLGEAGCSVAHCPTPFARYGIILESFGDYVRAGVNMAMGTDTTPHNMLEEIRKAGTFARIASRHVNNVSTGMLLQRRDRGRRESADARRSRQACGRRAGRRRAGRREPSRHDAGARPAPLARVPCGRSRREGCLRGRAEGGVGRAGDDARSRRRVREPRRGASKDDAAHPAARLPQAQRRRDRAVEPAGAVIGFGRTIAIPAVVAPAGA